MIRLATTHRRNLATAAVLVGVVVVLSGCSSKNDKISVTSPYRQGMVFAVAPILNFSGDFSLDAVRAADLLASELLNVEGVVVLPVNRVMAALAAQGKNQIESPAHAIEVAEIVGADAILVAGITEYDAYTPVVGVALQMYALSTTEAYAIDPITVARQAEAIQMFDPEVDARRPVGQVQKVYNARHSFTVKAVRRYAKPRCEGENPLGWRQYLKVQSLFLRFCWQDAIQDMMDQERLEQARLAVRSEREVPE